MTRRLPSLLLAAGALVLAGCSTFSDTNAVARVNDAELSADLLDDLMVSLASPQTGPADLMNADEARRAITIWVSAEVQAQELEARGAEIAEESRGEAAATLAAQLPEFTTVGDEARDVLVDLVAGGATLAETAPPVSDDLVALYERGVEVSNLICVSHILVVSEQQAQGVVDDLAEGVDFGELAGQASLDAQSGAIGGDLGCWFVDDFSAQFVPEFVAGALAAEIGVPSDPVQSEFGFHVILVRSGDDAVAGLQALQSSPRYLASQADIHVSSRYGTFDLVFGVVPLG